jgi:hypothetical protein
MNKSTFSQVRELKAPPTIKGFAASHNLIMSGSTELSSSEQSILRKEIKDFDELPSARQSAADLAQIIENEERREISIESKDIELKDDMSFHFGETEHHINQLGFKSLARAVGPQGATSYLTGVDPALRAYNMRALLSENKTLKLRTRNGAQGEREIYAITEERYPDVYANSILRLIATNAETDAKAEFVYDPSTTTVSFKELMRSEIELETYRHDRNDVFQIGREWSMRDDGATSVKMNLLTFRMLCANMLILKADTYLKHVRHRGENDKVLGRVQSLFSETDGFSKMFSQKWGAARITKWNEEPTHDAAVAAYGYLITKKFLTYVGDKDRFANTLATKWAEEPGGDVADLINGVTRLARNSTITNSNTFGASELEKSAGRLLTLPAHVWEATRRV